MPHTLDGQKGPSILYQCNPQEKNITLLLCIKRIYWKCIMSVPFNDLCSARVCQHLVSLDYTTDHNIRAASFSVYIRMVLFHFGAESCLELERWAVWLHAENRVWWRAGEWIFSVSSLSAAGDESLRSWVSWVGEERDFWNRRRYTETFHCVVSVEDSIGFLQASM